RTSGLSAGVGQPGLAALAMAAVLALVLATGLGGAPALAAACLVAVLVFGILALDRFQDRLVDVKVNALKVQAQMSAGALSEAAIRGRDATAIDREAASQVLRRIAVDPDLRARLYDVDGNLVQDTALLLAVNEVEITEIPPATDGGATTEVEAGAEPLPGAGFAPLEALYRLFERLFFHEDLPIYVEYPQANGLQYEEVGIAASGQIGAARRETQAGELIVSVAIPIQKYKSVQGVLLLSSTGGDIQRAVDADRRGLFGVILFAVAVTIGLAAALAVYIARPLSELAQAADRATEGRSAALLDIKPFKGRYDEIGQLSYSLGTMARALYDRLEANERFAADVSHEIKNPLSSIRSAIETMESAKSDEVRSKLMDLVKVDIRRLDKLITDIADASRVDAELARAENEPVNLKGLLETLVDIHQSTREETGPEMQLHADRVFAAAPPIVIGHENRLVQLFRNLVSNAVSFSPEGGRIDIHLERQGEPGARTVLITVEDEGPGIPPENLASIFERFYTSRPEATLSGKNSGLGLSISKLIAAAHQGEIWAENRDPGGGSGARFRVRLPLGGR
ncbi:MAG: stimulus-sensing domain-containing protein, partial [Pseudomonadota bacterium]